MNLTVKSPGLLQICLLISLGLHILSLTLVILSARTQHPSSIIPVIDLSALPSPSPSITRAPNAAQHAEDNESPSAPPVQPPIVTTSQLPVPGPVVQTELGSTPLGQGMMYGYVDTLAEGVTLRDDIRDYYFRLVTHINNFWWKRAGAGGLDQITNNGVVDIFIARDGTLLGRQIRISSGSWNTDRQLLKAIDDSLPLPALPDNYGLDVFTAPLKIVKPSNLFRAATPKQPT